MSTRNRLIPCVVLFAIGFAAVGCGGAGPRQTQRTETTSTGSPSAPIKPVLFLTNEPVATVGRITITRGALRRWVAFGAREQLGAPEPPNYTACIEFLRSPGTSSTVEATERLKNACAKQYEELAKPALSSLIHAYWVLGQARQEGLRTAAVPSDAKLEPIVNQLTHRIYAKLEREVPTVTSAQIVSYYQHHRASFLRPEQRDLNIIRSPNKAAAEKAKKEIEDGASFATVANRSSEQQPPSSRNGVLLGLGPHQFGEPPLSRAVFSAPLKTLRGPVEISLGSYIFEVTHRTPARQATLAEAKSEIATQLHQERREGIFSRYVATFRKKWQPRTSCHSGSVVKNCRQYGQTEAENPTTL